MHLGEERLNVSMQIGFPRKVFHVSLTMAYRRGGIDVHIHCFDFVALLYVAWQKKPSFASWKRLVHGLFHCARSIWSLWKSNQSFFWPRSFVEIGE